MRNFGGIKEKGIRTQVKVRKGKCRTGKNPDEKCGLNYSTNEVKRNKTTSRTNTSWNLSVQTYMNQEHGEPKAHTSRYAPYETYTVL